MTAEPDDNLGTLDREARSLLLSLVLRGAPPDVAVAMLQRGLTPVERPTGLIVAEYERLGRLLARRNQQRQFLSAKALWMLGVQRQLAHEGRSAASLDVCEDITAAEFYRRYYFRNRPLLLKGYAGRWYDLEPWAPARLAAERSDATVEVMTGRESDADHEISSDRHRRRMRLGEYLASVTESDVSDDAYMVANNKNLAGELLPLLSAIAPLPGILTSHAAGSVHLWIGPAGTVTKLHHDTSNVLFTQAFGGKTFYLVPPYETELVYNQIGAYSSVDAEHPDLARYPFFDFVDVLEAHVDKGDALFIPVGWWHHVKAVSTSVSLSFTNFVENNFYAVDSF